MAIQTSLGRRNFLVTASAVAGGFSLGFGIPFDDAAQAAEVKEINAWVVIHPYDKVVIRIARSEMGQGTLTGLAQLVAEELECDWSKVTTEYPTPGENLRRKRVWRNFSTGGSRGIRESNDYVREGGAVARGDAGTVAKHLQTLAEHAPESLDAYIAMGRLTAARALASGTLDVDQAAALLDVLSTRPHP